MSGATRHDVRPNSSSSYRCWKKIIPDGKEIAVPTETLGKFDVYIVNNRSMSCKTLERVVAGDCA